MKLLLLVFIFYLISLYHLCLCRERYNEWKAVSEYLNETMDHSIDPCQDFYGFVCGKWNKTESLLFESQHKKGREDLNRMLVDAIKKIDILDEKTPKFYKSLANFYHKCTAKPYDNETIIKDIYQSLDKYFYPEIVVNVNGSDVYPWEMNDSYTFWKFIGKLQGKQNTKFLISADVSYITVNCTLKSILIITPTTVHIEQTMLDVFFEKVISEYHNITLTPNEINETKTDMINLEKDLQTWISSEKVSREGRTVTFDQLLILLPHINWAAYFDGLLPEDVRKSYLKSKTKIVVQRFASFENLHEVLQNHDLTTIYNVAYAAIIQRFYNFFVRKIEPATGEWYSSYWGKIEEEICLDYVYRYFSAATARLIFDQFKMSPSEWQQEMIVMAQTVFSSFRYLVYSLDWMSMEDKVKVVQKINTLNLYGDLPNWLSNDDVVNKKTPIYNFNLSLVDNDILAQECLFRESLKPLVTGISDDQAPTFGVNAWYWGKKIKILLHYQLPPYYHHNYPLAVKFGQYGWVVGHELLHAFDSYGINQPPSTLKNWLSNQTLDIYKQKMQCYIQQYSQHCFKEHKKCISGRLTISENTADVEGIKVAYMAFKFASQIHQKEPPLEGEMGKYTWDQIFFISGTREFCDTTLGLKLFNYKDPHSPAIVRVERSLMNFPSFAKAFNCKVGSKFAPIKSCSIWGRFSY